MIGESGDKGDQWVYFGGDVKNMLQVDYLLSDRDLYELTRNGRRGLKC